MEEFVARISAQLFVCKFGNSSRWLSHRTRNETSSRIRYKQTPFYEFYCLSGIFITLNPI